MNTAQNLSPKDQLQQKYRNARYNLLLMVILTAVNIVMFLLGSESMMLFSASIPYFAVIFGAIFGGTPLAVAFYAVAAALIAVYLLCWLFSKKHYGWLIAALVLFVLDTVVMIFLYIWSSDASGIVDVLLHAWVLYCLIVGIIHGSKLKKLPAEQEPETTAEENAAEASVNSAPIRRIGEDEKSRTLLEENYGAYRVCYRRVKRTNQLVINDYIYAEAEYLMEPPHSLKAIVNGHVFEVGYDGRFSYFHVDGQQIKKKVRWY